MTEWETTKIKANVKERAKDLDPTYSEIMMYGIEAYTAGVVGANDNGDVWVDGDVGDLEPFDGEAPTVKGESIPSSVQSGGVDADAILEKLEQIESAQANTVSDALELAENPSPVTLEAMEYNKIADEIEERLR